MSKESRITYLIFSVALVFALSSFFDFFNTYLLFQQDYSATLQNEVNREIVAQVQKYGTIGALLPSSQQVINWLLCALLGSSFLCAFFFDDLKERYHWYEKLIVCSCLSLLLISSLHVGAGLVNLTGLLLGRL